MKRLALVALALVSVVLWIVLLRREPAGASEREEPPARPPPAASVLAPAEMVAESAERTPIPVAGDEDAALASSVEETEKPLSEPEVSTRYHAIVLDALTRRPIAGARARVAGKSDSVLADAFSDGGGRFALPLSRSMVIGVGRLEAGGYGTLAFVYDVIHDTPARADELELLAAAGLEVVVSDAEGRPLAECEVALILPGETITRGEATMMMNELASWRGLSDATGRANFEPLPAEEALAWRVGAEDDPVHRQGRIALEAGEHRRLAVQLGGRARLAGRVRDENGTPVAGLELRLGTAVRTPPARERGGHRAVSDESGRYAFDGLAYDEYSLRLPAREERFVLVAEERVLVDRATVEHDIDVVHALFLSGRITGPPKETRELQFVHAKQPDGSGLAYAQIDADAFRIGPLAPGEYLVWAADDFTGTATVSAVAGASDVELPVLTSRDFDVRVDGAEGELAITVLDLERVQGLLWNDTSPFELRLPPGRYALQTTTTDGRIAYRGGLEVTAGGPRGEIVLRAEAGARCTFIHRATSGTRTLRLLSHGELFLVAGPFGPRTDIELLPGASRTVLLPPGRLEAELLEGKNVAAREELVLQPGERRRIELAPR